MERGFLDRDKLRADDYDLMKKVIDKYHKHFIDKALEGFKFDLLQDYTEAFYSQSADDDGKKFEEIKKKMCKELATCFSKQDEFKLLDKKELVEKLIPAAEFIEDEEKDIAKRFKGFTTYFTGFNENRENLYAAELKHGTIAFRLIEENLPAFLYNCKKGVKIFEGLDEGDVETLNNELGEILSIGNVKDILNVEYYNKTLTQNGIDVYNQIIGGYTQEDGTKIKGVNEYVNLYNQTHDKKLPSLAKLKKQILSDSYSLSFLPAKFNDDSELLWENTFYSDPLIAILSCVIDGIEEKLYLVERTEEKVKKAAKTGVNTLAKLSTKIEKLKAVIEGIKTIIKDFHNPIDTAALGDFKSYQKLLKATKEILNEITQAGEYREKQTKLVILVDEIDRCLPDEQNRSKWTK